MPIYEYACKQCEAEFEILVSASRQAACPSCGSSRLERKLSSFAVQARASTVSVAPCGTCGDPRGVGSCGLN